MWAKLFQKRMTGFWNGRQGRCAKAVVWGAGGGSLSVAWQIRTVPRSWPFSQDYAVTDTLGCCSLYIHSCLYMQFKMISVCIITYLNFANGTMDQRVQWFWQSNCLNKYNYLFISSIQTVTKQFQLVWSIFIGQVSVNSKWKSGQGQEMIRLWSDRIESGLCSISKKEILSTIF